MQFFIAFWIWSWDSFTPIVWFDIGMNVFRKPFGQTEICELPVLIPLLGTTVVGVTVNGMAPEITQLLFEFKRSQMLLLCYSAN